MLTGEARKDLNFADKVDMIHPQRTHFQEVINKLAWLPKRGCIMGRLNNHGD
jgi:hypothetical protein